MSGWKDWAIGEVVTESDFQSFVQDQVVQVYDDSTDRDNTLGTAVAEGMVAYLKDTNATQVYNGTAWIPVGEGDITAVTAGTALTGGGTAGDVTLDVDISAISTAQAGNALNANGELLDVDESAITVAQSQVTDLVSDLADKADNADFTGGTAGYTALSNGTAGLSYQPVSHNYVINGAFDIWQRGTSLSDGGYLADRWVFNEAGGGVVAQSQQSFTAGTAPVSGYEGTYFLRANITTAYTDSNITQRVEDVRTLAGQTVTISFFAKGPASSSLLVRFSQNFGSGGSASVSTTAGTANLTTAWQRFAFTVTIPSIAGKTIGSSSRLEAILGTGSQTGAFDLWGVQLEAGSIATPFKRHAPSLQGELAACQRYYYEDSSTNVWRITGFARDSSNARAVYTYPTTMRANPSIEFSGDWRISYGTSDSTDVTLSVQGGVEAGGSTDRIEVRALTGTAFLTAGEGIVIKSGSSSAQFKASAEL